MRTARLTLIVASVLAGAYSVSAFMPSWSHRDPIACGDKKKVSCGDKKKQDDKKKDDKKSYAPV